MGFTAAEAYNLPLWRRKWFIERVVKEISSRNSSRATHDNDHYTRTMQGNERVEGPSRTRRFT